METPGDWNSKDHHRKAGDEEHEDKCPNSDYQPDLPAQVNEMYSTLSLLTCDQRGIIRATLSPVW